MPPNSSRSARDVHTNTQTAHTHTQHTQHTQRTVRRQHDLPGVRLGRQAAQEGVGVAEAVARDQARVGDKAVAPVEAVVVLARAFFWGVCVLGFEVGEVVLPAAVALPQHTQQTRHPHNTHNTSSSNNNASPSAKKSASGVTATTASIAARYRSAAPGRPPDGSQRMLMLSGSFIRSLFVVFCFVLVVWLFLCLLLVVGVFLRVFERAALFYDESAHAHVHTHTHRHKKTSVHKRAPPCALTPTPLTPSLTDEDAAAQRAVKARQRGDAAPERPPLARELGHVVRLVLAALHCVVGFSLIVVWVVFDLG